MYLNQLPLVVEAWSKVVAVQTQILERISTVSFIESQFASPKKIPVFLWNLGQKQFKQVKSNLGTCSIESTILSERVECGSDCIDVLDTIDRYSGEGVFILENLQSLILTFPAADSFSRERSQKIVSGLINLVYNLKTCGYKYLILLDTDGMNLPVRLAELIPELQNPLPNIQQIRAFLKEFIPFLAVPEDVDIDSLTTAAAGLTVEEIKIGLRLGMSRAREFGEPIALQRFALDYKIKRLTAFGLQFVDKPIVPDLGGLDNLKEIIEGVKLDYTEEARSYQIPLPKGILLVGPPGTGKSLSAKVIADKLGLPLIVVDAGAVHSGGAQFLRQVIARVDASAPAVLYFDEFDKLFTVSSPGDDKNSHDSRAVLGVLLTWLQEKTSKIYVIATLNRLSALPPELTRKGRFDELLYVDFPNARERREIVILHCARFDERYRCSVDPLTFAEWRQLLNATEKCTSSEIAGMVEAAATKISRRYIEESISSKTPGSKRSVYLGLAELLEQRADFMPLYLRDTDRIIALENESRYVCRPASTPDCSEYAADITSFWGEKPGERVIQAS